MLVVCVSQLSPFCAAVQVLCHFRDRFISEVDANAIVFDLEHEGIIPNGVLTAVSAKDATLQNQILHAHLVTTSTRDSLMTVCDKIIGVSGNPKMRALGKDMKSMLESKSRVYIFMHVFSVYCMAWLNLGWSQFQYRSNLD